MSRGDVLAHLGGDARELILGVGERFVPGVVVGDLLQDQRGDRILRRLGQLLRSATARSSSYVVESPPQYIGGRGNIVMTVA